MSKQKKDSSEEQWFLRTGVDAVFGPVDRKGLLLWAEQARVLPGHEVSCDRKEWKPAVSIDFLDMQWFVDDGDGELKGPLNRQAAETLIKNGKFSEKAVIVSAEDAAKSEASESSRMDGKESDKSEAGVKSDNTGKTAVESAAESNALKTLRKESNKSISELSSRVRSLEAQLRQSRDELKQVGVSTVSSSEFRNLKKESETLRHDLTQSRKKIEELQDELQSRDNRIEKLERRLEEKSTALAENERKIKEAVQLRERALQQSRESERSFARLLSDANKRDVEYKSKIEALKKNLAISPDQTDRFFSDQNAVYQVLKRELDAVTKTMEKERQYMESLKQLEMERLKDLDKHRLVLQNHLGNSPAEMTSRVSRENVSDPNAVRLRSELDNLKLAHQRSKHQFEERERDLNHKIKVLQADYTKLMDQLLEKERQGETLQKTAEKLASTEHELMELRRGYDAERKQFVANNNALAARVVELEGGIRGVRPEEVQSAEAKGVKLASWMSFKK